MTEDLAPVALIPHAATHKHIVVLHAPVHSHTLLVHEHSKYSPQERRVLRTLVTCPRCGQGDSFPVHLVPDSGKMWTTRLHVVR